MSNKHAPHAYKLSVNLHKLSRSVSTSLPLFTVIFTASGYYLSEQLNYPLAKYLYIPTVFFLCLTLVAQFYRHISHHAILRNFGILGQGRYILESIGPELRQYLFASDVEERPFNRAERSEVYRKSRGVDSASSFGSLMDFNAEEIKIRHSMYPLETKDLDPYSLTFGSQRGIKNTYTINRPFLISAMSYGTLGENAVRTFARGAKLAGIPMNTGEGGYPKYHLEEGCDLIFQMGTAKFGVRNEDGTLDEEKLKEITDKPTVKMLEIKFSQGAKPGKGGLLPKEKITDEIAELRGVPKGKDVISPTHHSECRDAATTVAFIKRIQEITGIPVGIKMCVGSFRQFHEFVREMKSQNVFPDYIAVDGSEGGTGAAPRAFLDGYGVPLYPGLHGVNTILKKEGVRDRLNLIGAGKLVNPSRQMVALSLGAQAIYSARGFMLAIGCIQALQCGNNSCPIGITTHDPHLTRGLEPGHRAPRVKNYVDSLEHDFYEMRAATGCKSINELSTYNLFIPSDTTLAAWTGERKKDMLLNT